jgi:hypothetical protein
MNHPMILATPMKPGAEDGKDMMPSLSWQPYDS